jgi:methylmalonyl-CoA/ethylmalonyl-CoA epimerase
MGRAPAVSDGRVIPTGLGPLDHVAIVVRDIDESLPRYQALFGMVAPDGVQVVTAQAVRICFLPTGPPPSARIELIQPLDAESGVARFLASRGEGLHHVCFGTSDLTAELDRLEAAGAELIDHAPRPGAEGPVAFVHPRTLNGVLWELLQTGGPPEDG